MPIEAVGLPAVWEQTAKCIRPGGTAVTFEGPAFTPMIGASVCSD
jgi:hypothetical protein